MENSNKISMHSHEPATIASQLFTIHSVVWFRSANAKMNGTATGWASIEDMKLSIKL